MKLLTLSCILFYKFIEKFLRFLDLFFLFSLDYNKTFFYCTFLPNSFLEQLFPCTIFLNQEKPSKILEVAITISLWQFDRHLCLTIAAACNFVLHRNILKIFNTSVMVPNYVAKCSIMRGKCAYFGNDFGS